MHSVISPLRLAPYRMTLPENWHANSSKHKYNVLNWLRSCAHPRALEVYIWPVHTYVHSTSGSLPSTSKNIPIDTPTCCDTLTQIANIIYTKHVTDCYHVLHIYMPPHGTWLHGSQMCGWNHCRPSTWQSQHYPTISYQKLAYNTSITLDFILASIPAHLTWARGPWLQFLCSETTSKTLPAA